MQDRVLELAQRPSRLKPELLDERAPRLLVSLERLGLTTRAVQRQHQVAPKTLPDRVLEDECLQLADDARVSPQLEVGLDSFLECRQTKLLEAGDLRLGERLVRQIGKRGAAPQRKRLAEPGGRGRCIAAADGFPRLRAYPLKAPQVQLLGLDADQIAGRARDQNPVRGGARRPLEQLAQARDMHLERLRCGLRRLPAPQLLDQAVTRNDLVRVGEQDREQCSLFRSSGGKKRTVRCTYLERPENPKFHGLAVLNVPAPGGVG